jgi:hypothetical protein
MDSSVKTLTITGAAAHQTTANDPTRPRRSSAGRSRKKRDEPDVGDESHGKSVIRQEAPLPQPAPTPIAVPKPPVYGTTPTPTPTPKPIPTPTPTPIAVPKPPVYSTTPTPTPHQSVTLVPKPQSSTPQKVILNPPKNPRVKLNPKMLGGHASHAHIKQGHTRKARRFIVPNLSSRFTRAKKLGEETKKTSIDDIRSYLVGRGVIQAKSKVGAIHQ